MRAYNDTYPIFLSMTLAMKKMIIRELEFNQFSNPRTFLNLLLNEIDSLEECMTKNPSINAQNFAALINNEYLKFKEDKIEGVTIHISFVENANKERFSRHKINLGR